ncbi:hypothetical protein T492DRAFT_843008 [Pavlovales sp. CCMP2436]|nr:hypothetical protein T492DRAFT_843008 [Pavlovales sp. CCMP2436]
MRASIASKLINLPPDKRQELARLAYSSPPPNPSQLKRISLHLAASVEVEAVARAAAQEVADREAATASDEVIPLSREFIIEVVCRTSDRTFEELRIRIAQQEKAVRVAGEKEQAAHTPEKAVRAAGEERETAALEAAISILPLQSAAGLKRTKCTSVQK